MQMFKDAPVEIKLLTVLLILIMPLFLTFVYFTQGLACVAMWIVIWIFSGLFGWIIGYLGARL